MGRLTRTHVIEAVIFLLVVVIFYAFSFEFNQPIEIYRFGATAWPRVVIGLLLIATLGNIWFQYKNGSAAQGTIGQSDDEADFSEPGTVLRMFAVLLTPFLFAWLLKPVGIYFSAPFFIAAIIWLFGERRWRAILVMTFVIYVLFIGLFLVILNAPLPQGNTSPFYDFSAWVLTMNAKLQGL
ncbi:tripartite tricarboxylate transporter TctB family protein [Ruegeria arenilitoris]|uniref:tripartite tricarboxylate transporter TctB family protein n=1 Tax=Ruegeria arenilitoris TaxID=1173585 RepID=UPI00147DCC13|nr:tripartite tricarboxylate transporter TctB family protein [Ruegeria arenilitoris]